MDINIGFLTAKGWLLEAERMWLYNAARSADVILNIGIEYGASLHCLRAGNAAARIVAIDVIGGDKFVGADVDAQILKGDSAQIVELWGESIIVPQSIDLAFIDGDHSYDGVMADTRYLDLVPAGGVAAFHDCYDHVLGAPNVHRVCPGVNAAVDDWYESVDNWTETDGVGSMRIFMRLM